MPTITKTHMASDEQLARCADALERIAGASAGLSYDSVKGEYTGIGAYFAARRDGRKYTISEQVQVLLRDDDSRRSYYLTDLSEINAQDYDLTGWYDDLDHSAGGHIRIIVATPKE